MKRFKRIAAVVLSLVMVLLMIPFSAFTVNAQTNGIQAKLDKLRSVYDNGTYFTASGNAAHYTNERESHINNIPARGGLPAGNTLGLDGTSCWAFAQYCYVYIFGHNFYQGTLVSSPSIGDILVFNNGAHYAMYLGQDANNWYVYDANYGYYMAVRYSGAMSKSIYSVTSIYHANNWDQVYGTTQPSIQYTTITPGDYWLKNNATGKFLAVDGGIDADQQNISVIDFSGSNAMRIAISNMQSGYALRPIFTHRIVNPYGFSVTSGLNVSLWPNVSDITQWWGFQKVDGGYVIRNMQNQNCVLDVQGTNVIVSNYTGAASQIWSVIPVVNYTLTFDANGGTGVPVPHTKWHGFGAIIPNVVPTRTGYNFLGWTTNKNATSAQYQPGSIYTDEGNRTLYAVWAANAHTVVFKNWDGTVLSSKTYHYGDEVTEPADPTRAADNTYTYTFAGWNTAVSDCVGNATYTATYTSTYKNYTVVFKDWNGTVLSTKTYHYGDKVTVPTNPTRAADNTYTYTFKGWDKSVAANCAGNATYTATYTSAYKNYSVVFKDWNGTVLSAKTYHYGDKVTVPASPTRAADDTYTYTFKGWDKAIANNCVGNATYTAVYNSVEKAPALSADNNLAALIVRNTTFSPAFSADILSYTVSVPFETSELNISAIAADGKASVEVIGGEDLIAGQDNIVKIICTAENGVQKEYIVIVKRAAAPVGETPQPEDTTESVDPFEPSDPDNAEPSVPDEDIDEKTPDTPDVDHNDSADEGFAWWWLLVGGVLVLALGVILGICLGKKKK